MTEDSIQFLSQQKYEDFKEELEMLKQEKIPDIARRIDDARQMGDLSENAEYHQARDDMSWAQARVKELQYILDNAELITDGTKGIVSLGSSILVSVKGKEKEYSIVGAQEADPLEGKISNESPLGEAFLGKKEGECVEVEVPAGVQEYKILKIS